MGFFRVTSVAVVLAAMLAACVEPPVQPIPDSARRSVTAITGELSGVKNSDTSRIDARGKDEGARLGAAQGAHAMSGGSVLNLLLMPIGAAVGGVKGATEAQTEDVVDATRSNLSLALQQTDFTEMLRSRLAESRAAGDIEIVGVGAGSPSAPMQGANGAQPAHILTMNYQVGIYQQDYVNPQIGLLVTVTAQVMSPDRKSMVHKASWIYCGERRHFVDMGANDAAGLRAQFDNAATILAEAIPYDLYVSRQPRPLKIKGVCMDFSDLPSGNGKLAGPARS